MKRDLLKKYVGGSDADEIEFDDMDMHALEENSRENRKRVLIALTAIIVAVLVVTVYFVVVRSGSGAAKSRKLVETYMDGLGAGDLDKVQEVMDPDTIDQSSMDTLVQVFKTYKDNNLEYSVNYVMEKGYRASDGDIEAVCKAIYGTTSKKSGVDKGYVIPVTGTIDLSYKGETSPYDLDMKIICYEKNGNWYLGGTIDNETDTSSEASK